MMQPPGYIPGLHIRVTLGPIGAVLFAQLRAVLVFVQGTELVPAYKVAKVIDASDELATGGRRRTLGPVLGDRVSYLGS